MMKHLFIALLTILSFAACTDKINYDIDNPNETATVVMVYRHAGLTDSVFFGITGNNVFIDWGDGIKDSFPSLSIANGQVEQNALHKYTAAKDYVIKIMADDLTLLASHEILKINLTRATQLKKLHLTGSFLRELNLKSNVLLEELDCSFVGELGKLDLSANTLLTEIRAGVCELNELNIKNCSKLAYLACDNNRLSNLDLTGNPMLISLACDYNNLTSIDVSQNPNLLAVSGVNNHLTEVDLSQCPNIRQIYFDGNAIDKLVMTSSQSLYSLSISQNKLSAIDINKNLGLRTLHLQNNNISELDVSNNHSLTNIDISSNQFSGIALNKVFSDLTPGKYSSEWIRISSNPGTNSCDTTIATTKKWKVRMD